jgi:short-subunit dehydrogenase
MKVLITGATKGIGRAIVDRFAPHASELFLVARSASDLEALAADCARSGLVVHAFAADLSEEADVQRLVAEVLGTSVSLDVLVNNAGVYLPGEITSEPPHQLGYMMRLNVLSHYWLVRGLQPLLKRGAHVFHMASVASRKMFADKPSYSVTKHAQLALVDALRSEFRSQGIKVTAVMPGPTWSASWAGADFPEDRLLAASDVAEQVWRAFDTPARAVVEEIVIRPALGDLD